MQRSYQGFLSRGMLVSIPIRHIKVERGVKMQAVKKVPNRRVTAKKSRSAWDKEAQNECGSAVYSESLAC